MTPLVKTLLITGGIVVVGAGVTYAAISIEKKRQAAAANAGKSPTEITHENIVAHSVAAGNAIGEVGNATGNNFCCP